MYLVDTNVISEIRKGPRADAGVVAFLTASANDLLLPAQAVGELRRGVENVRRRGDTPQASLLEKWLAEVLEEFSSRILPFDLDCAQVWGRITGASQQNLIDKQIAAIALVYDLTIATRNVRDFADTGVKLMNPFSGISLADSR